MKNEQWTKEIALLKTLVEQTELEHSIKWGIDVYTYNGKNVLGIAPFKSYVGIWFYNGVFMKDPKDVFINAQEGKTKALRQWRFNSLEEIDSQTVLAYIKEAIENEKAGVKLVQSDPGQFEMPEFLEKALTTDPALNKAFEKLTPGKQKEYAEYISSAKREQTRLERLEKIKPMVLEGVGLNDKYKK
ncbi:YdeI/OmpD-associated family protein [Shivajiella indica]|uniref:YdeI family protein n=1 Tax=Shivajiella indica TaxID=872115 RepID=A0ABW5BCG3_9BACT